MEVSTFGGWSYEVSWTIGVFSCVGLNNFMEALNHQETCSFSGARAADSLPAMQFCNISVSKFIWHIQEVPVAFAGAIPSI